MLVTQCYISTVAVNARLANKVTPHTLAKATKIGKQRKMSFLFNTTILAHAQLARCVKAL